MNQLINKLENLGFEEFKNSWTELPHITYDMLFLLACNINSGDFTPRNVFEYLQDMNVYLNTKQFRKIQSECSKLFSNYSKWYLYDHALCSRVTDRWNLTPNYRVEGYYYCSVARAKTLTEPPYKWNEMKLDDPFF
jgi:hypothetical protein